MSKNEKLNFSSKLHLACAKEHSNPALNCVYFKDGYAYATNGAVLVKQSLEYHRILSPDSLNGKFLHGESFKAILGYDTATATDMGIEVKDEDGRSAFFDYFQVPDDKIPAYDEMFVRNPTAPIGFIGVNVDYLEIVSAILFKRVGLRLIFGGLDKTIYIDTPDYENQCAIVSPFILEEALF